MKKLLLISILVFTSLISNAQIKQGELWLGGADLANSIIQSNDGGYAITGASYSAGNRDVYVAKLDIYGNLVWSKTIGGKRDDVGNSIIQSTDGGYVVAGYSYSYGDTLNGNVYVIKLLHI